LRKAGTPFEIASTPVTAAPPEANALATTNADMAVRRPLCSPSSTMPSSNVPSTGRSPNRNDTTPHPMSTAMQSMKK
jgi:hypothetical protein